MGGRIWDAGWRENGGVHHSRGPVVHHEGRQPPPPLSPATEVVAGATGDPLMGSTPPEKRGCHQPGDPTRLPRARRGASDGGRGHRAVQGEPPGRDFIFLQLVGVLLPPSASTKWALEVFLSTYPPAAPSLPCSSFVK